MSATAYFNDDDRVLVAVALDECVPGASGLGAVEYVEGLLTALDHDPPHLWAAPASGTRRWHEIGPWERHAWTRRIEGYKEVYRRVIAGDPREQDLEVVHHHACEATYGDPSYGGNRDGLGWERISFPEPMFPPSRDPHISMVPAPERPPGS